MRRTIFFVTVFSLGLTLNAQNALELAKAKKQLNKANLELLEQKPTKEAKKSAKVLKKEGWQVPAGKRDIASQITTVQLLSVEQMADTEGNPIDRFLIQEGKSIAGSYNVARDHARIMAMTSIASALETKILAALQTAAENKQSTSITTTSLDQFRQKGKMIIDACLTNIQIPLTIFRITNQMYEVSLQVACDKKELSKRLAKKIQQELELELDNFSDLENVMLDAVNVQE